MLNWQEFPPGHWVITGIIGFHLAVTVLWIVFKIIWGKRVAPWWLFIGYSGFILIFWPFSEISRNPRWRRKWLQRAGVKEGDVVLDEGFGMGTSAIAAARLVGPRGKVYALDNEPVHVVILWLRAKIRRLKNLKVFLSGADSTRLPGGSVDVVYISDAFHEFPKERTLDELHRVLKPGGILAIWEEHEKKAVTRTLKQASERGLFSFVEQEKGFYKLQRI
jgi:ubiquinone/menaquinone biosynthesis C-methylase UbiE